MHWYNQTKQFPCMNKKQYHTRLMEWTKTEQCQSGPMPLSRTIPMPEQCPIPEQCPHSGAIPICRSNAPCRNYAPCRSNDPICWSNTRAEVISMSEHIPRSDVIAYPCRNTRQSMSMTEQYPCRGIPISEIIDKNDHSTEKCYLKLLLLITLLLLKTN